MNKLYSLCRELFFSVIKPTGPGVFLCYLILGLIFSIGADAADYESGELNENGIYEITSLHMAANVLDAALNHFVSGNENWTTEILSVRYYVSGMPDNLDLNIYLDKTQSTQVEKYLAKINKLSQIMVKSIDNPSIQREIPMLGDQMKTQLGDLGLYLARLGNSDVDDDKYETSELTLQQWKARLSTLIIAMHEGVKQRDWQLVAHVGNTISNECKLNIIPERSMVRDAQAILDIENARQKIGMYGEIAAEYAEDENQPHVIYFTDKMSAILQDLP